MTETPSARSAEVDPKPIRPSRPRVLLVEDNFLAATGVVRLLRDWGYETVGPVASAQDGCARAAQEDLCGAILDVSVRDGTSEPVGRVLASRRIPYFYVTGFNSPPLSAGEDPTAHPRLLKPIDEDVLRSTVSRIFGGSPS